MTPERRAAYVAGRALLAEEMAEYWQLLTDAGHPPADAYRVVITTYVWRLAELRGEDVPATAAARSALDRVLQDHAGRRR